MDDDQGALAVAGGPSQAAAADAFAETGRGFGSYIMVRGVIETVALSVLVFLITAIPRVLARGEKSDTHAV